MNTWENVLSKEDREHLQKFLPKFPDHLNQGNVLVKDTLKKLFNQENFKFGSPLKQVWQQLNAGEFQSNIAEAKEDLRKEQDKLSQQQQKESFMKMFEVLFKRHQSLLAQRIGGEGSDFKSARKRKKFRSTVEARAGKRFKMYVCMCICSYVHTYVHSYIHILYRCTYVRMYPYMPTRVSTQVMVTKNLRVPSNLFLVSSISC